MAHDTERNFKGTNFAVTTLMVLLVLIGGYFLIAQGEDMADDTTVTASQSEAVPSDR